MSYSYDFFAGHLQCPVCAHASAADHSTQMQTYIRAQPQAALLGVGAALSLPEDMGECNYVTLQAPEPGVPIRIGHTWCCPSCRTAGLWAEVVIADGVIVSVEGGMLPEMIHRLHFIVIDIVDVLEERSEQSYGEIMDGDIGALARAVLAE